MIQSYTPSIIMGIITMLTCAVLIVPALRFKYKDSLKQFYWRGFWIFPTLIAGIVGGEQILLLMGVKAEMSVKFYVAGLTAAYVFFVVFAWFRLTFVTVIGLVQKHLREKGQAQTQPAHINQ